jgi:GT2 family glycosyltransferase
MKNTRVAIIILNWNGKEDTAECLESIGRISYPDTVTIVVDNGSTDGSVAYLSDRYPWAVMVVNHENLGYAEGNNVGIRHAREHFRPGYFLVLNNDTVVDEGFLGALVEVAASDETVGLVGPKILYYHQPGTINSAGARMIWHLGVHKNIGIGEQDNKQYDTIREVDNIHGCAFLVKSEVIEKIGVLDKRFFLLLEETDFCLRARKAGFTIKYTPRSVIYHKEGISGKKHTYSGVYYSHRNRMLLVKKNYSRPSKITYALPLAAMFALTIGYYGFRNDLKMVKTVCKAYRDGLLAKWQCNELSPLS